MCEWLKDAYDASEALQTNVRRACELGSHYAALEKEVISLEWTWSREAQEFLIRLQRIYNL